jgi:hypothetical protein
MRKPFLSRLTLGAALVATIALGALAMRAALPAPETPAITAARPAASGADLVLKVERSDSAPVAPAYGPSTQPDEPAVASPDAEATPASNTGSASAGCAGEGHASASCPYARDAGVVTASHPTVAADGDHAPARTSDARASRAERRVSSGPMRMLGGGESTW